MRQRKASLFRAPTLFALLCGFVGSASALPPHFERDGLGQFGRGDSPTADSATKQTLWTSVEDGFSFGSYSLSDAASIFAAEVLLLRFDPKVFSFQVVRATANPSGPKEVRELVRLHRAIAGINANFFDEKGQPLGLVVQNGAVSQRLKLGGKVLTGVFYMKDGIPFITHRSNYIADRVTQAVQAGPRLIKDGAPIEINGNDYSTRRSGVAVTYDGQVILYATYLRIPGATLKEIQRMLLDKRLKVKDALNLDGGGSSQLFVERRLVSEEETYISGGDEIPVALIVKHR